MRPFHTKNEKCKVLRGNHWKSLKISENLCTQKTIHIKKIIVTYLYIIYYINILYVNKIYKKNTPPKIEERGGKRVFYFTQSHKVFCEIYFNIWNKWVTWNKRGCVTHSLCFDDDDTPSLYSLPFFTTSLHPQDRTRW